METVYSTKKANRNVERVVVVGGNGNCSSYFPLNSNCQHCRLMNLKLWCDAADKCFGNWVN